ncbi:MAG TPA: hypothetical protein VFQ39_09250 [Longimicrobium sp.]|nr:hypothetical protein [Longimicrobium sp.]
MPNLEINQEEAGALTVALRSYLGDLQTEISHTDDFEFRQGLQRRRELLEGFLRRVEGGA